MRIDGRQIASQIFQALKKKVDALKSRAITPHVAIILVGEDPASMAYVKQKQKKAEEIGAKATVYNLPLETSTPKLLKLLKTLNENPGIHGIIVQRPLPNHIDPKLVNQAVDPKKDVDAFCNDSPYSMPLAKAVVKILQKVQEETQETSFAETKGNSTSGSSVSSVPFLNWLKSQTIVVVGKGETGGGPVLALFKKMGIEPQIIDSKTVNNERTTVNADIIISTVGKANKIKAQDIKKGVILIGVGMHRGEDGKLHGDYEEEEIKNIASFYTPIPGGVGPVNVAMLLTNLVQSAQ